MYMDIKSCILAPRIDFSKFGFHVTNGSDEFIVDGDGNTISWDWGKSRVCIARHSDGETRMDVRLGQSSDNKVIPLLDEKHLKKYEKFRFSYGKKCMAQCEKIWSHHFNIVKERGQVAYINTQGVVDYLTLREDSRTGCGISRNHLTFSGDGYEHIKFWPDTEEKLVQMMSHDDGFFNRVFRCNYEGMVCFLDTWNYIRNFYGEENFKDFREKYAILLKDRKFNDTKYYPKVMLGDNDENERIVKNYQRAFDMSMDIHSKMSAVTYLFTMSVWSLYYSEIVEQFPIDAGPNIFMLDINERTYVFQYEKGSLHIVTVPEGIGKTMMYRKIK